MCRVEQTLAMLRGDIGVGTETMPTDHECMYNQYVAGPNVDIVVDAPMHSLLPVVVFPMVHSTPICAGNCSMKNLPSLFAAVMILQVYGHMLV